MVAITVSGPRGGGTSSAATLVMAGLSAGITSQLAFEGGVSGTSLNKAFGEAGHLVLPVLMSEVDSDRPSCLELHGRELLENLVPDGAHHVSLLPDPPWTS